MPGDQLTIKGEPDIWKDRATRQYAGIKWIQGVAVRLADVLKSNAKYLTIDLSNVQHLNLFEWTTLASMLEAALRLKQIQEISLDFVGNEEFTLLSVEEWLDFNSTGRAKRFVRQADFDRSTDIYRLVGFAEALGTRAVLNRADRTGRIIFPRFGDAAANFRNFYTRQGTSETLVLGLTRIESKEDCTQFLNERSEERR